MSLSSRFPKMLFALVLVVSLFGIGGLAQLNAQKITSSYRDKDTRTINVHFESDTNVPSSQIAAYAFYTDMFGTEHPDVVASYSLIGYDTYRGKWLFVLVYDYGAVEDETGVPVIGFRFPIGYLDVNSHPVITDELNLTWWGLQATSDVGTLTKLSKTTGPAVSILQTERWGDFTDKIPAGTTWMDIEVQDPATNKLVETLSILV